MKAKLLLSDGTHFEGLSLGAEGTAVGEVVFNTAMMGYQEILTDSSYKGQIITMTYSQMGNYGVNSEDVESSGGPKAEGLMGIYEGSAHVEPQGLSHKIIISQDRVATDVTGFNIINERRKEKGIPPVTKETAGHIWSAEKLGIGNADPEKIEVRKIHLKT